jgi:hypothetical protein
MVLSSGEPQSTVATHLKLRNQEFEYRWELITKIQTENTYIPLRNATLIFADHHKQQQHGSSKACSGFKV